MLSVMARWSCSSPGCSTVIGCGGVHVITRFGRKSQKSPQGYQQIKRHNSSQPVYVPYLKDRPFINGSSGPGFPHFLSPPRETFPFVVDAKDVGGNITAQSSGKECAEKCQEFLKKYTDHGSIFKTMIKYGAVLFRGFPLVDSKSMREFCANFDKLKVMTYIGNGGREVYAEEVYTTGVEPPGMTIEFHNEMSYNERIAQTVVFGCISQADPFCGGESIISPNREVVKLIDQSILDEFREKGVMYTYEWPDKYPERPLYLSWQEIFRTEDRDPVEPFVKQYSPDNVTFHWGEDGAACYQYVLPAYRKHPVTGEQIWLNGATNSNESSLRYSHPEWAENGKYRHTNPPYNTLCGDGTTISDDVLQKIRNAYWECAVGLQLQRGEVLVLDNMSVMHGRLSFSSGTRKIQVVVLELDDEQ